MAKANLNVSTISVGIPDSSHTVRTVCPHCSQAHSVLLAASETEGSVMIEALKKIASVSTADATYRTQTRKPATTAKGRPRKEVKSVTTRTTRAAANELAVALRTASAPPVAPHLLRPRFRYYAADRRKSPNVLSDTRRRIYAHVARSDNGVIEADLLKKGFTHGTIQQTMHWLRENNWVRYEQEIPAEVSSRGRRK